MVKNQNVGIIIIVIIDLGIGLRRNPGSNFHAGAPNRLIRPHIGLSSIILPLVLVSCLQVAE